MKDSPVPDEATSDSVKAKVLPEQQILAIRTNLRDPT